MCSQSILCLCSRGTYTAVGAGTGWLSRGIDDTRRRELKECELLSTYVLCIIYGQQCCPAGHVLCSCGLRAGGCCAGNGYK